eukprot:SAG11_NODE_38272_length_253_cov_0.655844_1_plen_23_part_10
MLEGVDVGMRTLAKHNHAGTMAS